MKFFNEFEEIQKTGQKLPHWHQDDVPIFITWRLDDSLPKPIVDKWQKDREIWKANQIEPWDEDTKQEYQRRFVLKLEDLLDNCHGSCVLQQKEMRQIVVNCLHFFDGERLNLDCYVVMPNHVHALLAVKPGFKLDALMKSIKGFSAREINKLTGSKGALWQADFWDRLVRSEAHLLWVRNYIKKNPAKLSAHRYSYWSRPKPKQSGQECPRS